MIGDSELLSRVVIADNISALEPTQQLFIGVKVSWQSPNLANYPSYESKMTELKRHRILSILLKKVLRRTFLLT